MSVSSIMFSFQHLVLKDNFNNILYQRLVTLDNNVRWTNVQIIRNDKWTGIQC